MNYIQLINEMTIDEASSIDRLWINKEIRDFNKGWAPYNTDKKLDKLIDLIKGHINFKHYSKNIIDDIIEHLELSYNEDTEKIETNANEIYSFLTESLIEKVSWVPEPKDHKRIDDIIAKSGNNSKAEALAIQMANSIDKVDKAYRRYMAAKSQGWKKLASIFFARYKELGGT